MSWWTSVPALTPVAAWDAKHIGDTLTDQVGGHHATVTGGVSLNNRDIVAVKGTGNLWPLASNVVLPTECTVAGFVKVNSNSILFYGGDSTSSYLFDQESSGAGHYFNWNSGTYGILSPGPSYDVWKFMAVVKRTTNFGLYINGGWVSETGGSLSWLPPSIGGFGYVSNGNPYNFDYNDLMSAAGVWSGAATLSELQSLEAAVREAMVPPPPEVVSYPFNAGRLITNSLALAPGKLRVLQRDFRADRKNIYVDGRGVISGTVTIENIPGSRRVRLFDKKTGLLVGETVSATNGYYEFRDLDSKREYFVVAHDHLRVYNGVIQDMLTP